VAKRCEIGPRLLLITNRKSHYKPLHMTRKSFAGLPTPTYGRPSVAKAALLIMVVIGALVVF